MAKDAPDGVFEVTEVIIVENVPIIPVPAAEYAIDSYGTVNTSSATYQELKSWTVTADRVGVLRGIELDTDNYAVAQFKIVVGTVTVLEDRKIPTAFDKLFPDLKIAGETVVTVSVKSDGSTTITAYCDLDAKEVG